MEEQRREDRENARWRGGTDARIIALERQVSELLTSTRDIGTSLTRAEGTLKEVRDDVSELRAEVKGAANQIDKGREDAVQELKARLTQGEQTLMRGQLSREQKYLVAATIVLTPAVSTVLGILSSGGFH